MKHSEIFAFIEPLGEELTKVIKHLIIRSNQLSCLENAGVDNWDGCSYAWQEHNKWLVKKGWAEPEEDEEE